MDGYGMGAAGEPMTELSDDEVFASPDPQRELSDAEVFSAPSSAMSKMARPPAAPIDDHGYAERAKRSPIEKAISPVTDYPAILDKMWEEGKETLKHGAHQLASPESAWDFAKGVGNTALGAVATTFAPVNAAYRTVVGQPVEDVTGIPREYTEMAAQLATPGLGVRPLSPKVPGAVLKPSEIQPSVAGRAAVPEAQSAEELGIPLSRGQATRDLDAIRYEDMASRGAYGPKAQEEAVRFFDEQFKAIQAAGVDVGETLGRDGPKVGDAGESATVVNSELLSTAEKARAVVAQAEKDAAASAAFHKGRLADSGQALDNAVQSGRAPVSNIREAGETVGQGVRDAADTAKQQYKGLYKEAFDLPGEFGVGTFTDIGNSLKHKLTNSESPVIIDDTTKVASRALDDLNKMQNLKFENRAAPKGTGLASASDDSEIVAVNLKGVDQARKLLVARYQQAKSQARATQDFSDQRAMERIIDAFDDHIEQTISNGLFSGDPRALSALQEARASFSNYRKTYRPNPGDDVSTALNRIVTRNATPEEIGNMIVGSGKIGNAGLPVRLADKLKEIFGADSDHWSAVRQAIWQKASNVRNAAGEFDAAKAANSINDFTNSTLARKVFEPRELTAMRSHASGLRDMESVIEALPAAHRSEQAKSIYQQAFGGADIGGSQATVFRRIMEGTATPQETTQAILGAVNSSSSGNVVRAIKAIEKIVGPESDTMNAIRQGVWQKLTKNAAGKDQPGQQKVAQAINEFLNGQGRMVAQQLYSPDELALMKKYADAIKLTVIPPRAATRSDTAPALMAIIHKYSGAIASAIGGIFGHGNPVSALTGYGVGKLLEKGANSIKEMKELNRIRGQFEPPSAAKTLPARGPSFSLPPVTAPGLSNPPKVPFLQSPSAAGADEDQNNIPRPPAQQHNGGQVNQVHGYADGGAPDEAIDPETGQPFSAADRLIPPPRNPAMPADWAQNAVRGAAGKLANIVMAPRRAMDQGMTTEEAVPWAGDTAMTLAGTGAPAATRGAAGIFGGKLAKTADQAALAKAQEMATAGTPREHIWNETGWFQGGDGKWRFEIPDNASAFNRDAMAPKEYRIAGNSVIGREGAAKDVLTHPEFYSAYPDKANMTVGQTRYGGGNFGTYHPPGGGMSEMIGLDEGLLEGADRDLLNSGGARSSMIHELQHATQQDEGFVKGGNPKYLNSIPNPDVASYQAALKNDPELKRYMEVTSSPHYRAEIDAQNKEWLTNYKPRLEEIYARGRGSYIPGDADKIFSDFEKYKAGRYPLDEESNALFKSMKARGVPTRPPPEVLTGSDVYRRLAGEVEARNVQSRMNMTPEERRARAPWTTEDVPAKDQIFRAEGGEVDDDVLMPPPRNPLAPPQGLSDAVQGAIKHTTDWAKVPGQIMHGVTPEVPDQWSETDEWRAQQLRDAPYQWGPQTAFSEVFWPRTGTNVGGAGFAVGSGATMPKNSAHKEWADEFIDWSGRHAFGPSTVSSSAVLAHALERNPIVKEAAANLKSARDAVAKYEMADPSKGYFPTPPELTDQLNSAAARLRRAMAEAREAAGVGRSYKGDGQQRAHGGRVDTHGVAIDNSHDVKSGAVASKNPNGPVFIDRRIPKLSPVLKDRDGNPANLWKYLTVHETQERKAMAEGMPYETAHETRATPAERAAVEADGVDWKEYTHEMDGYLATIEHEGVKNPPPNPHVDPNLAVNGKTHHHSETKTTARAEGGAVQAQTLSSGLRPGQGFPEQKREFEPAQGRGGSKTRSTGGAVPARAHGGRVLASNINHSPSTAQAAAGNYAHDHVRVQGLDLSIENAKGSTRRGVGADGKPWAAKLSMAYGFIKRTMGADSDHLDVYLAPHIKSPRVYVIDQIDPNTGKFDEHKIILGAGSEKQARDLYAKCFSDGKGHARIGHIHEMAIERFKSWLNDGDTTKPFAHTIPESEKREHASVGYTKMATDKDHCAICVHFIPGVPPACEGVKSPIAPAGWCRRYKTK